MTSDHDMSGVSYLVTFKHNFNEIGLHTVSIKAQGEHDAGEKLLELLPNAVVVSVTHPLS